MKHGLHLGLRPTRSYGEHKFIVEEYSDENSGDATFLEGEDNFNEEEQELIYEAVNEYM